MTEDPLVLDCLGMFCPVPIIELAKLIKTTSPGRLVEVLSDDEGAKVDIPVWCRMKRQEFLRREDRERGWAFYLRTT